MSRKLEKLITHGQKLEFKVEGTDRTSAANNIVPAVLTPGAKVALQQLQEINSTPASGLVNNPGTIVATETAAVVSALSA